MQGTLLIAILTVRSSYRQNVEEATVPGLPADTLQWWISGEQAFRIRTFALDHDIRVMMTGALGEDMVAKCLANNRRHYGDVIFREELIEFSDCLDQDEVASKLAALDLSESLRVEKGAFAFWSPNGEHYWNQSAPDE